MFKLPRLQKNLRLVDRDGTPALTFMRWFNMDFAGAIEAQEAAQAATDARQDEFAADLAQAVADIQAAMAAALAADAKAVAAQGDADAANAELDIIAPQVVALAETAQVAQATGNDAYARADEAVGGGTVSGSATNPSVNTSGGSWVSGPQVDLTSVVAGNLTITGSGPYQDGDTAFSAGDTGNYEFRVVEIVAGVDTTIFTGQFAANDNGGSGSVIITNQSVAAVAAYSSARSSTGNVSYRIDVRAAGGGDLSSLALYIYARRAA